MSTLQNIQNEFFNYLLDNESNDVIQHIESNDQGSATERVAYYGNGYVLRLKEALSTDYDRLYSYLGDDLFESLMNQYIQKYPSTHYSLRYFGQHMLELVEQIEPFSSLLEVAEITKIEQAFANSFDAQDCQYTTIEQLSQLKPEAWATLSLKFHSSVILLPQKHNSFQIWQALSNEETPPEKINDECTWIIWRQNLVSRYRTLDTAELKALSIVKSAGNFSMLCESILEFYSEEETPLRAVEYLKQWINDEMVCELKYEP